MKPLHIYSTSVKVAQTKATTRIHVGVHPPRYYRYFCNRVDDDIEHCDDIEAMILSGVCGMAPPYGSRVHSPLLGI